MRLRLCFALLLTSAAAFGNGKKMVADNISTLEKELKEYSVLFPKKDKLWKKNKTTYRRYRALRRKLRKHFLEKPEDFLNVDFSILQFEAFCSIAEQRTFEADEVYCELIQKFLDERGISPDRLRGWGLSDFAGSPASLNLLNKYLPYISKLKKSRVKATRGEIVRMEFQVEMYEELKDLNKDNTKDWKSYYFSYGTKHQRLTNQLDKKLKEMESKLDYDKWDTPEESLKIQKYNDTEEKLKQEMPDLHLDENPTEFFEQLPNFAKDGEKEIEFDFLAFFKLLLKHGGKMTNEFQQNILYDNVIMIKDQNGRLRYALSYSVEAKRLSWPILFYGPVHNMADEVVFVAVAYIYPYTPDMKEFFKKNNFIEKLGTPKSNPAQ